jgi:hypothetical protein
MHVLSSLHCLFPTACSSTHMLSVFPCACSAGYCRVGVVVCLMIVEPRLLAHPLSLKFTLCPYVTFHNNNNKQNNLSSNFRIKIINLLFNYKLLLTVS